MLISHTIEIPPQSFASGNQSHLGISFFISTVVGRELEREGEMQALRGGRWRVVEGVRKSE